MHRTGIVKKRKTVKIIYKTEMRIKEKGFRLLQISIKETVQKNTFIFAVKMEIVIMDFFIKNVFSNFLEVCFKYLSHFRKTKNTKVKLVN